MAVKRIGFIDNFTTTPDRGGRRRTYGPRTYVRSGPPASSPYYRQIAATYRPPTPRPAVNTNLAPTAQAQPTTTTQAAPQQQPAGDPAITTDPILLKAQRLAEAQRGDAATSATARTKELAIQTGDAGLAREFGLDESVQRVAAENPLSTLSLLRDEARKEERRFNESTLPQNLFFSGYRGEQLGELSKALLTQEAAAQARAREAFGGIQAELLAAQGAADQLALDAEADAYARAVANGEGSEGGALADALAPETRGAFNGLAESEALAQQLLPGFQANAFGYAIPDDVPIDPLTAALLGRPRGSIWNKPL